MSELTTCNYCNLKRYEIEAKKRGNVISLRYSDGIYVHEHAKDEQLDLTNWDDGNKQIKAWFMELSDECVC